jgi:hypothetical protein
MSVSLATNGYGFLLCWYSVFGQPEQEPIEKLKMKLSYSVEIYSVSRDRC